jgi:hypothetical protein
MLTAWTAINLVGLAVMWWKIRALERESAECRRNKQFLTEVRRSLSERMQLVHEKAHVVNAILNARVKFVRFQSIQTYPMIIGNSSSL